MKHSKAEHRTDYQRPAESLQIGKTALGSLHPALEQREKSAPRSKFLNIRHTTRRGLANELHDVNSHARCKWIPRYTAGREPAKIIRKSATPSPRYGMSQASRKHELALFLIPMARKKKLRDSRSFFGV